MIEDYIESEPNAGAKVTQAMYTSHSGVKNEEKTFYDKNMSDKPLTKRSNPGKKSRNNRKRKR